MARWAMQTCLKYNGFKEEGSKMAATTISRISQAVGLLPAEGQHGGNRREDVKLVQTLLSGKGYKLKADGVCGPKTIAAIKKFQAGFMKKPDGLIGVGQNTWKKLVSKTAVRGVRPAVAPSSTAVAPAVATKKTTTDQKINQAGLQIIKDSEGLYLKAYKCPAGVWTIGYGHTKDVKEGVSITEAQADAYLKDDVVSSEKAVNRLTKVDLTSNQFSALVSFTFNLGEGNLSSSTLLKKVNAANYTEAADEFAKWNKSKGKVLTGLTNRRAKEKELFLKKDE